MTLGLSASGPAWATPSPETIGSKRQQPSEFFSGQNYNEDIFVPATEQQNTDWSWWPTTQQSFNILSDGFRRKASGTSLVDSIATSEKLVMKSFENKGLSIRKEES